MFENNFWFLSNVFCIFILEVSSYFIGFNNYSQCINNICYKLIKENILFIKFFQSQSSTQKLPQELLECFKKNTNKVLYDKDEIDYDTLNYTLKKYNISLIDNMPMNAGMVSLVYIGKINGGENDGKKVIVKIKKREIKERLQDSCEKFIFLYNLLIYCTLQNDTLLAFKSFTESTEYLISQCNFQQEIKALQSNKKIMSSASNEIIIPHIYNDEIDNTEKTNFIVMEYLEGKFAFDLKDTDEKHIYAKQLIEYITSQYFFMEYLHSDLHLGNVICMRTENNELRTGIIDFGMHIELLPNIKKTLFVMLDFLFISNSSHNNFIEHINYFINEPIEISNYTKEEYATMNHIFNTLFNKIKTGILTEQEINKSLNEFIKVSKVKTSFNKQLVQIILSITMTNSTLFNLLDNSNELFEKYTREIIMNMLE
jgi:predicted unusual protein kinase regulating ubiquinone biosynthesis (AarF/ABC1/UbiB family)